MSAPKGNRFAAKEPGTHVYKKGRLVFDLGEERKQRFALEARRAGRTLKGHLVSILDERWNTPVKIGDLRDLGFKGLGIHGPPISFEKSLETFGICWRELHGGDVDIVYSREQPPGAELNRWHRVTVSGEVNLSMEFPEENIEPPWLEEVGLGYAIATLFDELGPAALFGLPPAGTGFTIIK